MNVKISNGVRRTRQKIVIYGPEGIGKSTLASQFPNPLFIDTEGSTNNLNINRFDEKPTSWSMLKNYVEYVRQNPGICETLVIDTMDWAERLCVEDILSSYGKKGIEDFGYGNGYVYVYEEIGRFMNTLQELIDKNICNVVLNCHSQLRKFEQPDEMGSYDRYELKLGKKTGSQTSPLIKEWADMILFCNYETYAVASDDSGKKFKGQGGRRVMYTTHHPCWDAKNRFDLPDKLPLDYSQIAHIIQNTSAAVTPAANPAPVQDPSAPAPDDSGRIPPVFQQPTSSSVSPSQSPPAAAANNNSVSSTNAGACTPPLTNDGRGMTAGAPCREMTAERFDVGDLSDFIEIPTEIRIPENIPQALKDLMRANNVSEEDIRFAVAGKGYFPERMPIEQYPPDFISGVLIAAWDQVYAIIKENQELPFN